MLLHGRLFCRFGTVQSTIDRIHLLGYLERVSWSHAIDIPANGLIIHPDVGDVLRYSQRDGQRPAR